MTRPEGVGNCGPTPSALRRAQAELLACLEWVDALCRAEEITYWIDSGTLLGAIRHSGFIPWDDDVDLCMTRRELRKFLVAASANSTPEYSVLTPEDDRFIAADAKIYVNGTHLGRDRSQRPMPQTIHDGLFIDIFVFDPLASSRLRRRLERAAAWLVKVRPWARCIARSRNLRTRDRIRWEVAARVPTYLIDVIRKGMDTIVEKRTSEFYGIGPVALFNGHAYHHSEVYPLKRVRFEGLDLPAPADPRAYLSGLYGEDYMTLPPPESRTTHASSILFDH